VRRGPRTRADQGRAKRACTRQIQRALCALTLVDAAKLPLAVEALYQAFWVERNAALVNKPEGLAKLLGGVLGEAVAKEVMQKVRNKGGRHAWLAVGLMKTSAEHQRRGEAAPEQEQRRCSR